jgi:hypothetical protein
VLEYVVRPLTVNDVSVPTDVRLLAVTPDVNVEPLSVPAAAVTVIAALPSKSTPLIARAVANLVAVLALPVNVPTRLPLIVTVLVPDVEPMLTAVVEPTALPVAMLTVLVVPVAVAAVLMFVVLAVVAVLPMFNVVAAPNVFTVVATVLNNVRDVCEPTIVVLRRVNVPLVAPIVNVVAAPKALTVVAVVLNKVAVVCVPTTVGLFSVSVPVMAPMFTAVAAPPRFTVVAVLLTMSKEVCVVVIPPEALTANMPAAVILPTPVMAPPVMVKSPPEPPTVNSVNVPRLVRLLVTTVEFNVSPVSVPAAAVPVQAVVCIVLSGNVMLPL